MKDKPLFHLGEHGWECTIDGDKEFIAAVPYEDKTKPGKPLWWIHYCIIEDVIGLCIVGDDENEPAGWDMSDVTHYFHLPTPPLN